MSKNVFIYNLCRYLRFVRHSDFSFLCTRAHNFRGGCSWHCANFCGGAPELAEKGQPKRVQTMETRMNPDDDRLAINPDQPWTGSNESFWKQCSEGAGGRQGE